MTVRVGDIIRYDPKLGEHIFFKVTRVCEDVYYCMQIDSPSTSITMPVGYRHETWQIMKHIESPLWKVINE